MRQQYQVALSFAGEERPYVEDVAQALRQRGIEVFYDDFEKVKLWGSRMTEFFHDLFSSRVGYVVMFISAAYVKKAWPTHERRSTLSRAVLEERDYVLPVRFDDTPLLGLPEDVFYLLAEDYTPVQLSQMIEEKLRSRRDDFWAAGCLEKEQAHMRTWLSVEARELLVEASIATDGAVVKEWTFGGQIIRMNHRVFGEKGNARQDALWEEALQELVDNGLLVDKLGDGKVFYLTNRDFQVADELRDVKD